jgi:cytosol alanyl aminopeptidase
MSPFRQLLAVALLLCVIGSSNATAAPVSARGAEPDSAPPRLAHDAVPKAQSVELTLDPGREDYQGRVVIGLDVRQSTKSIRFHARAMTLDDVSLRGPAGAVKVVSTERLVPDQARVHLESAIEPGAYTLEIAFHNRYNTRATALYRVKTAEASYLFTQLEDTEAREAFPCFDEPEFKIPWTMTFVVPANDLAVSNTPIAHERPAGAMKRVEFATSKPLPSYLIAIAVGPFETVPITGMSVPGRIVTVKGATSMAAAAARSTPAILKSLERYFGRPYPYEKLDLIAAPEFLYGAMENAGAIVFADRRLLIDPRSPSPEQLRSMRGVVAHELAHMWFGDLVTMKWWDDLWLNESFASWMATKVMDDVFPETQSAVVNLYSTQRAMAIDARPSTRAMRAKVVGATSLGQTANELTYDKGEAVLTMFEGWLGADQFRAGVLEYLKAHEWKNAEARDLWLALGKASGENIDAAMATFLDQSGVPLVTVEPQANGGVKLSQRRFLTRGTAEGGTWKIPVILRYPAGGQIRTQRAWLTTPQTLVRLETKSPPDWIAANAGAGGYYRWEVPEPMFDRLVAARESLTPGERIDLISDMTAMLRAGHVRGDRYLQLLQPFGTDPSPEVLRAVIEALNDTRVSLTTKNSEAAFNAYLGQTLEPAVDRFGMKPKAGEALGATMMRPTLLRLLANATSDARVLDYAEELGRSYRRDPRSVPPSLVETGLIVGAMRGDRAQFDDYRKRFESTTVPIERTLYLAGMGSFRDPAIRKQALDYALTGPLRPQEALVIPGAGAMNSLGAEGRGGLVYPEETANWMLEQFETLRAKLPPNFATRVMGLGGGCSKERLETLRTFFREPSHRVQGGDNTLRRLADSMEECAELHGRESARVERWLMQRAAQP